MLKGFRCPFTHGNISFGDCFGKPPCDKRCLELPLLISLGNGIRDIKDGVYSTTEILNPPRVVVYQRMFDFYLEPQSMVWATFGTSFHSMIEDAKDKLTALGVRDEYSFEGENFFSWDVAKSILTGTPDQYHIPTETLTDYKTLKYFYDIMYLKKGDWSGSKYIWQVNIYRRFRFPKCKHQQLVCLVKDFNRRLRDDKGISPIETIEVPWIDDAEVDKKVLDSIVEIERGMEDPETIRDCTDAERWKDNLRCKEYCSVADFCGQFTRIKEGTK